MGVAVIQEGMICIQKPHGLINSPLMVSIPSKRIGY
jgi:hypothetical protein